MSITRAAAREITTRDEQALVDESFHPQVRELTEAELKRAVTRARKLRDKYSDLSRRQNQTTKRAGRAGTGANARTTRKAQLFLETLERLEKRLAAVTEGDHD
jgi:hypothetical protein